MSRAQYESKTNLAHTFFVDEPECIISRAGDIDRSTIDEIYILRARNLSVQEYVAEERL